MLKSKCTVHRATESVGKYREKTNAYSAAASDVAIGFDVQPLGATDQGAGDAPRGMRAAYLENAADVNEQDVLEVTAGEHVGKCYRVVALQRPRNHHTEVELEPFNPAGLT